MRAHSLSSLMRAHTRARRHSFHPPLPPHACIRALSLKLTPLITRCIHAWYLIAASRSNACCIPNSMGACEPRTEDVFVWRCTAIAGTAAPFGTLTRSLRTATRITRASYARRRATSRRTLGGEHSHLGRLTATVPYCAPPLHLYTPNLQAALCGAEGVCA